MKKLFYLIIAGSLIISGCSTKSEQLLPLTQPVNNQAEIAATKMQKPVNSIQTQGFVSKNESGKFVLEMVNKKFLGKIQKTNFITYKYKTLGGGLFPYPHNITEDGNIFFGLNGELIFIIKNSYVVVGKWQATKSLWLGQIVDFSVRPDLEVKFIEEDTNPNFESLFIQLYQNDMNHKPHYGKPNIY